jgi:alanyl-tRNA synthetase
LTLIKVLASSDIFIGRGNIVSQIKAIYYAKNFLESTKDIPADSQIGIILDRTNFYAEQGGQEYDTGRILIDGNAELEVTNVQSYAGYVLHTGYMKYGSFSVLDEVISEYDEVRPWQLR